MPHLTTIWGQTSIAPPTSRRCSRKLRDGLDLRAARCCEEDVNTSDVLCREYAPDDAHPWIERLKLAGRASHIDSGSNTAVCNVRGGERGKTRNELPVVHI
jgi:hypothetical protein